MRRLGVYPKNRHAMVDHWSPRGPVERTNMIVREALPLTSGFEIMVRVPSVVCGSALQVSADNA